MNSETADAAPLAVTEVSEFERRITLRFDQGSLDRAKNQAARAISRTMNVKGFRRGKAPRKIIENMVGSQRVRDDAIEGLLSERVGPALAAAELVPAVVPSAHDIRETEDGTEVDILVTLWPTLEEIPPRAGRQFEVELVEITEEIVDKNLENFLSQFAELETVERPAAPGDYVVIDLRTSRNGLPWDSFTADDLLYEVGSGSLVEGLDENVTGAEAGETNRFTAVLPFQMTGGEPQGPVDISVRVKEVRQKLLPGIDDDWVSDHTEYETVTQMRSGITDQLEEYALAHIREGLRSRVVQELVEEIEMDIPEALTHARAREFMEEHARVLAERQVEIDQYLQEVGQTAEQWQAQILAQARDNLAGMILLDAVAAQAGVEVTKEELHHTYQMMSTRMEESAQDLSARMEGTLQESRLVSDMLRSKALDVLVREVSAVDGEGNPVDLRFEPLTELDTDDPDETPDSPTDSPDQTALPAEHDDTDQSDHSPTRKEQSENG